MALSRPAGQWPLILCGPMLRKVVPGAVHVFLAVKSAASVRLKVRQLGSSSWNGTGELQDTIALGKNLHVLVVQCQAATPLEPGHIYEYDLEVRPKDSSQVYTLGSLGLLDGAYPLGYAKDWLPSFSLPAGVGELKLAHASCRLPHGDGWDMLALLDGVIYDKLADPGERPHHLFLTGDQIYADDVAPCLLAMLSETGRQLLGWEPQELLPYAEGTSFVSLDTQPAAPHRACPPLGHARARFIELKRKYRPTTTASRAACSDFITRAELIGGQSNLTSDAADCHLLFLAEYYAMYLFAWSDALWPREGDALSAATAQEAVPAPAAPLALGDEMFGYLQALDEFRSAASASRDLLLRYAETVPRVRRVLANVPTAMMLDDHEVTDDWFLNGEWYQDNLSNPLSRRLIRNALLAYAAFQDWGNQPEDYVPGKKGWDVLNAIRSNAAGVPPIAQVPDLADTLLGLPPAGNLDQPVNAADRKRWDHVLSGPGYQALFLDERTWRQFRSDAVLKEKGAPELVSTAALLRQLDPGRLPSGPLTILVAGTPVFGAEIIELVQDLEARRRKRPEAADFEAWAANDAGLANLLRTLLRFDRLVVLSGDVHYGFVNRVSFLHPPSGKRVRLAQLCASALKNHSEAPSAAEFGVRERYLTKWRGTVATGGPQWRVGLLNQLIDHYTRQIDQARASGAPQDEMGELLRTRFELRQALQLGRAPVLPDLPGAAHEQARALMRSFQLGGADGWTYRVDGVQPQYQRYHLDGARLVVGGLESSTDLARYCVGHDNLGWVSFLLGADGSPVSVTQMLYFDFRQDAHRLSGSVPDRIDVLAASVSLTTPTDAEL
jgi:hypothetical protein